jgi:hypothetical protein
MQLSYGRTRGVEKLLDLTALAVALSLQYAITGRFSG